MRHPKAVFVLFAALALSWDFAPDHSWAAEEKPSAEPKPVVRTDLYGDPLPPGAIARMGSLRWRLPPGGGLTFTPDGKALAAQEDDGTIHLWDMNDGRELRPLKVDGLKLSWVFRFAPDGKVIAAKADDTVVLLDAASGRELRRMTAPDMNIACLAFSPDSTLLAVAYHEKLVRLWEVDSGKERAKLEGLELPVYSVDFSPDGRSLAVHEFEDVDVLHDKKAKCKTALRMWTWPPAKPAGGLRPRDGLASFISCPTARSWIATTTRFACWTPTTARSSASSNWGRIFRTGLGSCPRTARP